MDQNIVAFCETVSPTRMNLDLLPDELLEAILLMLPGDYLLRVASLVTARWCRIINSQHFWKRLCAREGLPVYRWLGIRDYLTYYFQRPYDRNLLRNGDAGEGLYWWNMLTDGNGGGVVCERKRKMSFFNTPARIIKDYCWATSYGLNCLYQVVDLEATGCSLEVLDTVRPKIICRDWFCGVPGVAFTYMFAVVLCSRDRNIITGWQKLIQGEPHHPAEWEHRELVIEDYPAGGRFLYFIHCGSTRTAPPAPCYAGYYGPRFGGSSVTLDLPRDTASTKLKCAQAASLVLPPSCPINSSTWVDVAC